MVLPSELLGTKGTVCPDCGEVLILKVCQSFAGYYLGYWCDECGPLSRETDYFASSSEAIKALENPKPYLK